MNYFTDKRSIHEVLRQLESDILACDNSIDPDDFDLEHQGELMSELEGMCEEQSLLEELVSLKSPVDCECFYRN